MVRISQFVRPEGESEPASAPAPSSQAPQPAAPTPQPPLPAGPAAAGSVRFAALARPAAPSAASRLHSAAGQQLYDALIKECGRVLEEARREEPPTLQELPALARELVAQVQAGDASLSRLSSSVAEGYLLARHAVNVAVLAVRVGTVLELSVPQLQEVALAALVHDVGIATMEHLVHQPAHLTPEQRARLREHPILAHRLLQRTQAISPLVCDVILQQHEREDGTGYPRQLSGTEIQEPAQLVGLAEAYEALTHDRPYRRHVPPAEALRTLVQDQRGAFRDRLLKGLLEAIPLYPVESWVRLSTGELAEVIAAAGKTPLSPTVAVRFDRDGCLLASPRTIELSRDRTVSILRAVAAPAAAP